jgi:hypothetical protein
MADPHHFPENALPNPQLDMLIDTLSIEELRAHEELAGVYTAAAAIAISSYNGRIDTSPVVNIPADHEPLVQQLFQRFDNGQGSIEFPYARGNTTDELIVSASSVARYKMAQRNSPDMDTAVTFFTALPF